jgi:hypothetical protein
MQSKLFETVEVDKGSEEFYIRITDGPFVGVKFQYGQIQFMGEDADGNGVFNFGYVFMDDSLDVAEESMDELHQTMGIILNEILGELATAQTPE